MAKKWLLSVVVVVAILYSSTALAVAPVGPPTAGLKTGQWSVGFGYAHGEIDSAGMDWKSDFVSGIPSSKAKDVKSDAYLAKFGYGISDNWEFYGLLGVADLRGKLEDIADFDGDQDFSGCFGTKYTFLKDGPLSWGTVYQMTWSKGKDSFALDASDYDEELGAVNIDSKFKMYDIFLAVGPTYEMKNWRIYVTLPHLLYHYELEYPALIDTASTGMPVENFSFSSLKNSSGVRFPSELCGLSLL